MTKHSLQTQYTVFVLRWGMEGLLKRLIDSFLIPPKFPTWVDVWIMEKCICL